MLIEGLKLLALYGVELTTDLFLVGIRQMLSKVINDQGADLVSLASFIEPFSLLSDRQHPVACLGTKACQDDLFHPFRML